MEQELYNDLNTLLSFLRSANVVELVRAHYSIYNNDAPPILLEDQIKKLQKHLDNNNLDHLVGNPLFAIETNIEPLRKRLIEKNHQECIDIVKEIEASFITIEKYIPIQPIWGSIYFKDFLKFLIEEIEDDRCEDAVCKIYHIERLVAILKTQLHDLNLRKQLT